MDILKTKNTMLELGSGYLLMLEGKLLKQDQPVYLNQTLRKGGHLHAHENQQ